MNVRLATFWPGLPAAWYRGQWRGLITAIAFAWLVTFLMLATFAWSEWIATWFVVLLWLLAFCYWLMETIRLQFRVGPLLQDVSPESGPEIQAAQQDYLKGNWFEAEARLLEITRQHPSDIAAALMLVGVLRHTGRWRPAKRRLEQIALLDAAAGWQFEIRRELQLIERVQLERLSQPDDQSDAVED